MNFSSTNSILTYPKPNFINFLAIHNMFRNQKKFNFLFPGTLERWAIHQKNHPHFGPPKKTTPVSTMTISIQRGGVWLVSGRRDGVGRGMLWRSSHTRWGLKGQHDTPKIHQNDTWYPNNTPFKGVSRYLGIWMSMTLLPRKLTWNWKITPLKRKIIFQTSVLGFHVSFRGCMRYVNWGFFLGGMVSWRVGDSRSWLCCWSRGRPVPSRI